MKSIQFMSKAEYKATLRDEVVFYKYPALFSINTMLGKKEVLSFLLSCCKSLGISTTEFNRLYMVEVSSKRPTKQSVKSAYEFILNKIGYAISPIKLFDEHVIELPECVYTKF